MLRISWVSQSLLACKSSAWEVKIVNQLFVGIDVGSQNNAVYLMKPDGEKHSSFSDAKQPWRS